jgi:hypothetical protein
MNEREYKELVLTDFDQKLAAGLLPPELVSRTRKTLKEQCINVCAQRFDPKDELLLRSFFGAKEDAAAYMRAIQQSSAEDFRTLNNFLNDRSINTAFNNINLLAWLIDFQPRPYHPNLIVPIPPATPPPVLKEDPVIHNKNDNNSTSPENGPVLGNRKKAILYVSLFMMIFLISYFIITHQILGLTGHEGCMVWSSDHYQPINCNQKHGKLPLLKLDAQKVADFKRVSSDTLSPRALGYVWYAKVNGKVEFYSDSGQHPVDTNKRLLRLTSHILNKYVFHVADPK